MCTFRSTRVRLVGLVGFVDLVGFVLQAKDDREINKMAVGAGRLSQCVIGAQLMA